MAIRNGNVFYVQIPLPAGARANQQSRQWIPATNQFAMSFHYPGLPEGIVRERMQLAFWTDQLQREMEVGFVVRFPRIVSSEPLVDRISIKSGSQVMVASLNDGQQAQAAQENIASYLCFRAAETRRAVDFL